MFKRVYNISCDWDTEKVDCVDDPEYSDNCDSVNRQVSDQGALSLIKPNYDAFGKYSEFQPIANQLAVKASMADIKKDTLLISNIYANASPVFLESHGLQLLLWVNQDLALPIMQSTDIHWSYNNGNGWSTPVPIIRDTRAEMSPVVRRR
ncbi:MAG: hypothetical protein IPG76_00015 [Acidobacteria bacterium]|nr:hypothetical protein [Acidobacteriota bacterium]